MTVRAFALRYASRGWPVFPCAPKAKEPFGKLAPHGVYSATTDVGIIRRWFHERSTLNIAIACGVDFFVLDIDPRHGGDDELATLEGRHGTLPMTPRALTGGGGMHLLFAMPHAGARFRKEIAPGVELKGPGGYVIAAPSTHPSGRSYTWDVGALPSETTIAAAPSWLLERGVERAADGVRKPVVGPVADSFLGVAFAAAGWTGRALRDGKYAVRCPWAADHSDERGQGDDSSSALLPPTSSVKLGAFVCTHAHCAGRSTADLLEALPRAALAEAIATYPDALTALRRRSKREATR